jgi:hypothetical protein
MLIQHANVIFMSDYFLNRRQVVFNGGTKMISRSMKMTCVMTSIVCLDSPAVTVLIHLTVLGKMLYLALRSLIRISLAEKYNILLGPQPIFIAYYGT